MKKILSKKIKYFRKWLVLSSTLRSPTSSGDLSGTKLKENEQSKSKGQTLIEMVVASGIILTITLGILSLATSTIYASIFSRKKIQAINLAQEGLEIVRNIRDTNWLEYPDAETNPDGWKSGLDDSPTSSTSYKIVSGSGADGYAHPYQLAVGEETPLQEIFTRKIFITTPAGAANEKQIKVEVSWRERNNTHTVFLFETLTDWSRPTTY